jgi:hypothetical protein
MRSCHNIETTEFSFDFITKDGFNLLLENDALSLTNKINRTASRENYDKSLQI